MKTTTPFAHAIAVGAAAADLGFDWEYADDALDKVSEEVSELRQAMRGDDFEHTTEELGDLLFAIGNVARKLAIDPDEALRAATQKFERRFKEVLRRVEADGHRPEELSLDELEAHWLEAKTRF